ncbi:MAG: hypothetical protein ACKOXV_00170 [Bacteroidota bacterium]
MEDTSGFYKLDNSTLLFGPNGTIGPGYELLRQEHDGYTYPVDGWYWFGSEAEANGHFGIEETVKPEQLVDKTGI